MSALCSRDSDLSHQYSPEESLEYVGVLEKEEQIWRESRAEFIYIGEAIISYLCDPRRPVGEGDVTRDDGPALKSPWLPEIKHGEVHNHEDIVAEQLWL